MNVKNILLIGVVIALMASLFVMAGCNTWKGVGKDVERTGDAMQGD